MGNDKFAFCSKEWVAVADQFLKGAAKDADLSGIEYSFSEVFANAPAELNPDAEGRIGWYFRVHNGAVEAGCGILEDPDASVVSDYEAIVPLARMVFADNPDAATEAQKVIESLVESGNFTRTSKLESPPDLPWTGNLHDVLARHTL